MRFLRMIGSASQAQEEPSSQWKKLDCLDTEDGPVQSRSPLGCHTVDNRVHYRTHQAWASIRMENQELSRSNALSLVLPCFL